MRSKAPLALMEQLIMVAVFALAAAVCVQAFTLSGRLSKDAAAKDRAVIEAQTVAEVWKSCADADDRNEQDTDAAQKLGGTVEQGLLSVRYDKNWNRIDPVGEWYYQVSLLGQPSETTGVRMATVQVDGVSASGPIYTLQIACQEAAS